MMSCMAVLRVRVDDDTLAVLKAYKVDVGEFIRSALDLEARRYRGLDGLARLRDWSAAAGPEPVADLIRNVRSER